MIWPTLLPVASLVLLNGPPASGKSTLAALFVAEHPLALSLDIDVVRGQLGCWLEQPEAAGLAARSLALSMARTHLEAGHDVIVPQFLAKPDFIDQLEALAKSVAATFVEVALILDRSTAVAAFTERSEAATEQAHRDAAALVERSTKPDPLGSMHDQFTALLKQRSHCLQIRIVRGDIPATFDLLERTLQQPI